MSYIDLGGNMVEIGDRIKIISENDNYDSYRRESWEVEDIAYSEKEHPGYDPGVGGPLVSCEGLPFSLYEWEFEEVYPLRNIKNMKACMRAKGYWDKKTKICWG